MLGLIEELGFSDKVRFPRPFTVMLYKGKFYPFDSIIKALLFPGLGWGINKIRFGLVGLYLRLTNNWQAMEKTTVDSWMRKWAGNKVYETMWEPMLKGKFGAHYKEVNMAWMWARIHARTSRLGTYQGGFQAFTNDISGELKKLGVDIRLSTPVKAISEDLIVETENAREKYDRILVSTSPGLLSKLVPALPESYHDDLRNLKSMGAVVLTLSLKNQLSKDGYYWYNLPKDQGFPFLAVVDHTNYLSPDYFGGDHIVYCGDYRDPDHEYFSLAQPVPELNHSEKIPPIETPLSGLYFASMSQVYPWDRGTNFAVEIGRRAAALMMRG